MKNTDRGMSLRRQMAGLAGLGAAACFALVAAAGPAVAFFPAIFTGGDVATY
jgi:hypothetical protein